MQGNTQNEEVDSQNANVQEQSQNCDATNARNAERSYRASEEFRAACEARYVLAMPLKKRREYLSGVEEHRGKSGRVYLEQAIWTEWDKRKAPNEGG